MILTALFILNGKLLLKFKMPFSIYANDHIAKQCPEMYISAVIKFIDNILLKIQEYCLINVTFKWYKRSINCLPEEAK